MTTDHRAQRDDSEVFRAVLIEDARKRAGDHPALDTLVDYLTDVLEPEADERVLDHLAACRECVTVVLDLEPLVTPDEVPEGVADLELEAAWRDLQARIQAPNRLEDSGPGSRPFRAPRWTAALAASLVLAVVGLSAWVSLLQRSSVDLRQQVAELSRPQVNVPVFYVDELTRGSKQGVIEVEVPPEASYFVLIFASAEFGDYDTYEIEFFNADGEEELRTTGLKVSDSGGLRLGLSRGVLPGGEYLIRLHARDGEELIQLDEFRRRISYPGRP